MFKRKKAAQAAQATASARSGAAGIIDAATPHLIRGWAHDPDRPLEPVVVEVHGPSGALGRVLANLPRADLAAAGYGDGMHGFELRVPLSAKLAVGDEVRALRVSDGQLLAPGAIQVAAAQLAGAAPDDQDFMSVGCLDHAGFERVIGWAWDPKRPDEPIEVDILDGDEVLLTLTAGTFRSDLLSLGVGNGCHGFSVPLSPTLFANAIHRIRARRHDDGVDLAKSPVVVKRPVGQLDASLRAAIEGSVARSAEQAPAGQEIDGSIAFLVDAAAQLLQRKVVADGQAVTQLPAQIAGLVNQLSPEQWLQGANASMAERYPPLLLPQFDAPRVSVVIPVHGKFKLTYDCIASIAKALPKASFELIIVDDCSKDETLLAPLVFGGTVQVLRNAENLGFVGSCNAGAAMARGEFLFFLNNDTLVHDGWLDHLVETFETLPGIGIAGSKLLFADGKLQEVGGIIWRLGDAWNWGRNASADEPRFNHLRDADYVSGAALMIPTALFRSLDGFDKHFAPAYYEDTDLCFRVRQAGHRVVVQPLSTIVHLEGQSNGTAVTGSGLKRYQAINHRKFYERWKDVLASHRFNGDQPELECERTVTKHALFIDDCVPMPDQDAGSNAALQHIKSLMRLGYKVTFIPADNMARIRPYTDALQAMGVECLYHPHYWSVEEYLRKHKRPIDLVYLHRFTNATKYAGLIRRHQPKAHLVYNVADLHFLRMEREAELTGEAEMRTLARRMRRDELSAVAAVDATIVHSEVERELLATLMPEARVQVVPWAYPPRAVDTAALPAADAPRRGVMFVGGYRHTPNVDAARWLVTEIMPHVWREIPDLPVTLVGSHMPEELKLLGNRLVRALGFVPDTAPVYAQHLLAVAPLRYGAGVKGKVLEAFASGTPCVMTACAAEGVALDPALSALIGDDAEAFARVIVEMHRQPEAVARARAAGRAMIAEHYSEQAVDRAIDACLSQGETA